MCPVGENVLRTDLFIVNQICVWDSSEFKLLFWWLHFLVLILLLYGSIHCVQWNFSATCPLLWKRKCPWDISEVQWMSTFVQHWAQWKDVRWKSFCNCMVTRVVIQIQKASTLKITEGTRIYSQFFQWKDIFSSCWDIYLWYYEKSDRAIVVAKWWLKKKNIQISISCPINLDNIMFSSRISKQNWVVYFLQLKLPHCFCRNQDRFEHMKVLVWAYEKQNCLTVQIPGRS